MRLGSVVLSQEPFFSFMSAFMKDHARIRVELVVTNLLLGLIAENLDVAIRVGELPDSSVVARRLGTIVYCLVAAPEYLKSRSIPAEPADLKAHDCVMFNAKNNERDWELVSGRRRARVMCRARPRVVTSTRPARSCNGGMALDCCLRRPATKQLPRASSSGSCRSGLPHRCPFSRSTRPGNFCLRDSASSWRHWQPGKVRCGSSNEWVAVQRLVIIFVPFKSPG